MSTNTIVIGFLVVLDGILCQWPWQSPGILCQFDFYLQVLCQSRSRLDVGCHMIFFL